MILAVVCTIAIAIFLAWRLGFPANDVLKMSCPACNALTHVRGIFCEECNTRERILLRAGPPKGSSRVMQILLYHCACNSRMIYCDLKCSTCGTQISDDRRTELRPLESYVPATNTQVVFDVWKQNSGQEAITSSPAVSSIY